jgi:uncharacterized protein YndB with AHSA1/START domain
MTEPHRSLELEIEVDGTPEEVWRAIATGPGISSWYVPHVVEEREGGAASARFGPGADMEVPGRVAVWEPPHRVVFDGGDAGQGLAFEWLIEARDGGTCVVRLVNSGFGTGEDWDAQYDGMAEGWRTFLLNLQLHLRHFPGRTATAALPMAMASAPLDRLWVALVGALGVPVDPTVGQRVELVAGDDLELAGRVVDVQPRRLTLLVDEPAAGTAFVAVEGMGDQGCLSVWSYLYDADGAAAARRDEPRWQEWLNELASAQAAG